ncbi:MAG: glycosyltransferase family 2 protein [Clostridiales bacterium]|nr:glycosyltransferase family 2 protein [Clostridiales bacterium]
MNITIGIVAYNEEKYLPSILEDITKQNYPHENIEIVLADSMSEDQTPKIMLQWQQQYQQQFYDIKVIENKGKIQSCGWNAIIDTFTTEALIRIDAHSSIPEDFVEKNVTALSEGEYVTGGMRPNMVEEDSPWQQVLLLAESSMFGSSIADFRRKEKKAYVKSFFHGAYRREVFEKAGKFREDLGRTEDNEFHYRIRQKGFKLCMVPGIVSYQRIRPSLRKMCQQKYGNGYWVGLTLGICPGCLSLYHFVPFAFICGILLTTLFGIAFHPLPAILMWTLYWLLAIGMGIVAVWKEKKDVRQLLLPFLFFVLHISYGVGTCLGLLRIPTWKKGKERNLQ